MKIEIITPHVGEEVSLHNETQREFLINGGNLMELGHGFDYFNPQRSGDDDTHPVPLRISWEVFGEVAGICTFNVLLSLDKKFKEYQKVISTKKHFAYVYNLYVGKKYYLRVDAVCEDKVYHSSVVTFTTKEEVRFIHVPGGYNMRDLGGLRTFDGKHLKQGIFYRGGEIEESLTPLGLRVMRKDMDIRTHLSLRGEKLGRVYKSILSTSKREVKYFLAPISAYEAFLKDKYLVDSVFCIFSEVQNYPIYFHCLGGADRTGTVAMMIEAVAGYSDEDIIMDYELTSLGIYGGRGRNSDFYRGLTKELNKYGEPGDSMHIKFVNYLLSIGITEKQIDDFRKNILE